MRKELSELRLKMQEVKIDAYVIFTGDFHGSEYVGDYFKCREYISGFTGSAGTLVVLKDRAGLWTDGRYFIQAEAELCDSGIDLYKMGEQDVLSIKDFLKKYLKAGDKVGFDGRCTMTEIYQKILFPLTKAGLTLREDLDLVGEIWRKRPKLSHKKVWRFPDFYAGKSVSEKLFQVRQSMKKKGADYSLVASLNDIAWLLNVRGNDVACTPVALSYLLMDDEHVFWYVNEDAVSREIEEILQKSQVYLRPYEKIYEDVRLIPEGRKVLLDPATINVRLKSLIPSAVKILSGENPSERLKAVKNPVEVENQRLTHVKDGVAVTRFIYWLKHLPEDHHETELTAQAKLASLRKEQSGYIEDSFSPIIAANDHGAIVHYAATEESVYPIPARGFLLSDTGGQYLGGTTDITRTISFGRLTYEEKEIYTTVLKGHIALSDARFLKNCSGRVLDILARTPLWSAGYDYKHGTGHGVGYVLGVHENPVNISVHTRPGSRRDCPFEEGMITSNEPGCYLSGKFGVRLENLMVCKKSMNFGNGNFLEFETLTVVPYDIDAILPELLTVKEREWLNAYHKRVYDTLYPLMENEAEKEWLKQATASINN